MIRIQLTVIYICFASFLIGQCPNNLLDNPDFENTGAWQLTGRGGISADANNGSSAFSIEPSQTINNRILQIHAAESGKEYTFSSYVKGGGVSIGMKFLTVDYQPDNEFFGYRGTSSYTQREITRTAPANAVWIEVSIYSGSDAVVLVDDACLTIGGTTKNDCSITPTISNIICNDVATANDPTDDTFSFNLLVEGINASNIFRITDYAPNPNLTRDYGTTLIFDDLPINGGDFTLSIEDGFDTNCSTTVSVTPPASCSNPPPSGDGNLVLFATGDPTIAQWSNGTALFEITNQSGETFENVQVTFDFDSNIRLVGGNEFTSSAGTTLEQSWSRNPVWNIGTMGAGNLRTIALNIYSITNEPMEIYAQISQATGNDMTSTPGNGTPPVPNEDDEVLWQINGGTPPVGQADLTLSNLSINSTSVQMGDVLSYNFDVANIGNEAIPGNFTIKSYISTDNNISADDIQDGVITTGNFGVGNSSADVPGASMLPVNLAEGDYYLILKVDADDEVDESNEGNNVVSTIFTIDNGNTNPTPPCPGNLLTNSGFENGLTDWDIINQGTIEITTDANSGNTALKISGNEVAALTQIVPADPGSVYRLTFWGKKTGSTLASGVVNGLDAGAGFAMPVNESTEFQRYVAEARTNNSPPSDRIQSLFTKASGNATFIVDDVCLQNLGVPNGVDLALSYSPSNSFPDQWSAFTSTIVISNNGDKSASGIEVQVLVPDEVVYQGGNEANASIGTFEWWNNRWIVGNLEPGQSAALSINLYRLSANVFTIFAQVMTQNEPDIDSTPGNQSCCFVSEDDEISAQIGPSANSINNRNSVLQNLSGQPFAIVGANPNPTTGRFNVEVFSNENQTSEMTIVDILGRPVFKKQVDLNEGHNSIPIDLENSGAGMMMVKMTPFHPYLRQIRVMKVRD